MTRDGVRYGACCLIGNHMAANATLAGMIAPTLRRERLLAAATLAMLVTCVFDVGRVLYYRMVLNYAVTHSARVLARNDGHNAWNADRTAELVRLLSGVKDVSASTVRMTRPDEQNPGRDRMPCTPAASALVVKASYTVPVVSPPLWAVFRNGRVSLDVAVSAQSAG